MENFQYYLEENLYQLFVDINSGKYRHGGYAKFIINENKRREISVANIRDRIVHRLLYSYLTEIYDKTFIFDVWSCRRSKGLIGAIERTQKFLGQYPRSFVWRSDIKKFFDNVDHKTILKIATLKISDQIVISLLTEVINSYQTGEDAALKGVPIGNLTSQIFANIYLNELDRFVKHDIKPQAYLRYGDDFIIIEKNKNDLLSYKKITTEFIAEKLKLEINHRNDILIKARQGLHFLGVEIFPKGRRLNKRNWRRTIKNIKTRNIASYKGLVNKHSKEKKRRYFDWIIEDYYNE